MYIVLSFIVLFYLYFKFKPKNIYHFISLGDKEKLIEYIKLNPKSVNYNKHFVTPLSSAIWYGDIEIIDTLLKYGANPNLLSSEGDSAVHRAGYRSDLKILKLLEEYGADFNQSTNYNRKYTREMKPFYELQYFSPSYLESNKEKIESYIKFYKDHFKRNNIDLKLHSWMLDFDSLMRNSKKMHSFQ